MGALAINDRSNACTIDNVDARLSIVFYVAITVAMDQSQRSHLALHARDRVSPSVVRNLLLCNAAKKLIRQECR